MPKLPPLSNIIAVNAPNALPTPPDGYRLTRLAVLPDDPNDPDVYFDIDYQQRFAARFWVEHGYGTHGLFALAVFEHPTVAMPEVFCEWSEQNAQWSNWRVGRNFGSMPPPTAAEIAAQEAAYHGEA